MLPHTFFQGVYSLDKFEFVLKYMLRVEKPKEVYLTIKIATRFGFRESTWQGFIGELYANIADV